MTMAMPCEPTHDGVGWRDSEPRRATPDMNPTLLKRKREERRCGPGVPRLKFDQSRTSREADGRFAARGKIKNETDSFIVLDAGAQKSVNCGRESCTWRFRLTRRRRPVLPVKGESELH